MQHLFREFAERLSVKCAVELQNLFIFMTAALRFRQGRVPFIQTVNAFFQKKISLFLRTFRLTAAANASAGTGHDFYEVILYGILFLPVEKFTYICRTVDNRDTDLQITDTDGGIPETVHSADRLQIIQLLRCLSAGNIVVGGSERGFHDTAGVAEDDTGAGAFSHKRVIRLFRQCRKVNSRFFCPLCKLSGCDDIVHVAHAVDAGISACRVHFIPADLEFLGSAGRQSNVHDFARVYSHLTCKIGFNRGPLHSDRAFGC